MIVDDDRSMVRLLQTLLTLDGFLVVHESRGSEILNAIRAEKPDVVMMDKNLGGADGLELLKQIRADVDLHQLPVVIASGEDVAYKCRELGANDFVLKPYSPDELTKILKKVIR